MQRERRTGLTLLLPLLVVVGYGAFFNGTNWNHISRYDAIFSFVEPGTPDQYSFRIDHFLVSPLLGRNTGDWARSPVGERHFYSNKAPGLMMLGVPLYGALYGIESAFGAVPESHAWTRINAHLLNVALTAVPAALAALLFFLLLQRSSGLHEREALALTLLLFFGTALFPYATQLWGHTSVSAFGIFALYFLYCGIPGGFALSGFFAGLAVLSEYSAAISLLGIVILLGAGRRWRALVHFGLGGLPVFLAYGIYHHGAFGSWLTLANAYNNPKFLDPEMLVGVFGGLRGEALLGLSFSAHHGLFYFMPILLAALPAVFLLGRGPGRELRLLALGNVVGFLLMNLHFNGWHGGFCLGPRYLIPSLPYWVLLLVPLVRALRERPLAWALPIWGLALVSVANMTVLTLSSPSTTAVEERHPNPLAKRYASLLSGRVEAQKLSPIRLDGDWLVEGERQASRNNVLALGPGRRAESFVRMSEDGSVRFLLGWQGALELAVNGEPTLHGPHPEFARETVERRLWQGDNKIEIALQAEASAASAGDEVFLVILASRGRPRLPRASAELPDFPLTGSHLGSWLGWEGVSRLLPWLVAMAVLTGLVVRSTRPSSPGG